jgi:hypothetical protein
VSIEHANFSKNAGTMVTTSVSVLASTPRCSSSLRLRPQVLWQRAEENLRKRGQAHSQKRGAVLGIVRIIALFVIAISFCAGAAYGLSLEVPESAERELPTNAADGTPTRATPAPRRACEDKCGNGQCEEIVCMAVGCPCSENPETCSQDCTAQ